MEQKSSLSSIALALIALGVVVVLTGTLFVRTPPAGAESVVTPQAPSSAAVPSDADQAKRSSEPLPMSASEVVAENRAAQVAMPENETSEDMSGVTESANQVIFRPERFPNEHVVRLNLLEAQSILFAEHLGSDRYQQKLLEVEALLAQSISDPVALAAVIEEAFASVEVEDPRFARLQERMKADVEKSLGFLWAQSDPEGSLAYAIGTEQESVLTGWMTSQILAGKDVESLLGSYQAEAGDEVVWEALLDVSKTDTMASLNQILNHHLDDMTLGRWREILFNGHNASDSTLAAWFQENAGLLEASEQFDEVEVVRMLRRLDPGDGPFMNSLDLALVDQTLNQRDYAAAASLFEELSVLYEGTIDASAVGDMPLDWASENFSAATEWLLANGPRFSNQETLHSLISSVYRSGVVFGDDPEGVLASALSIEDETYRAMALSNVLIPQVEDVGLQLNTDWVRDLPEGFAKQRVMAGYVLGLSRHSNDTVLEAQVKFQFLEDAFDVEVIKQLVAESGLTQLEKNTTLLFLETY
jgi:hypothetical protein